MTGTVKLVRKIPLVAAVNIVVALSGIGFQLLLSRRLEPEIFGAYVAIISLLYAIGQIMESYSLTVAKEQVSRQAFVRPGILMKVTGLLGLGGFAVFMIFDAGVLDKSAADFYVYGAVFSVMLLWAILWLLRGIAQVQKNDTDFIYSRGVESLARLAIGFAIILTGMSLAGALLAGALGAGLAVLHLGYALYRSGRLPRKNRSRESLKRHLGEFLRMAASFIPLALFIRLDTILAPKLLTSDNLGIFGALSTVGKAVLLYSLAMSPLIFPPAVRSQKRREWIELLILGCTLSAGLLIITAGVFFLFGPEIIAATFGEFYRGAGPLMPLYLMALVPLAIHCNVINLQMAKGGKLSLTILWLGLIGYFVALTRIPETLTGYIGCLAVSNGVLAIAGFLGLFYEQIPARRTAAVSSSESGVSFGYRAGCGIDGVSGDPAPAQIEGNGSAVTR